VWPKRHHRCLLVLFFCLPEGGLGPSIATFRSSWGCSWPSLCVLAIVCSLPDVHSHRCCTMSTSGSSSQWWCCQTGCWVPSVDWRWGRGQYFTLPHMSLWTLCRLCGVCVESIQTPRTLIHLSKVHMDSVQTPHGLRMDFVQTYTAIKYIFTKA
jgi:hypothetical protein